MSTTTPVSEGKTLIILFGHTNDIRGELSEEAKCRCDAVIEMYDKENFYILPTGAFGPRFNTTYTAHGLYLTRYLIEHDIPKERILSFTNSSNTLEDILCARKTAVDFDFTSIIALTSDYHMQRVRFICERIFNDVEIEFKEIKLPTELSTRKNEEEKIEQLHDNWSDIPLYKKYSTEQKCSTFPTDIYENSEKEHKHYDTLSLATVSGILFVGGYPFLHNIRDFYLISAFANILLLLLYIRLALTARTARKTMRLLEIAYDKRGFSTNILQQRVRKFFPGIYFLVCALGLFLILLNLVKFLLL